MDRERERKGDPRLEREYNARFEYDLRNRGPAAAADNMFARNAERRNSDMNEAKRKLADHVENNIGKELERIRKKTIYV